MIKSIQLFVVSIGIFTLLSMLSYFGLVYLMPSALPTTFWLVPAFYGISCILLTWFYSKASNNKQWLSLPMLIGARLVIVALGLLFLFIGLFFDRDHAVSLTVLFVIFYIVFSILETKVMLDLNKKK